MKFVRFLLLPLAVYANVFIGWTEQGRNAIRCSGALVTADTVVTHASCVNRNDTNYWVRAPRELFFVRRRAFNDEVGVLRLRRAAPIPFFTVADSETPYLRTGQQVSYLVGRKLHRLQGRIRMRDDGLFAFGDGECTRGMPVFVDVDESTRVLSGVAGCPLAVSMLKHRQFIEDQGARLAEAPRVCEVE